MLKGPEGRRDLVWLDHYLINNFTPLKPIVYERVDSFVEIGCYLYFISNHPT